MADLIPPVPDSFKQVGVFQQPANGPNGSRPYAGLVEGSDRCLYGTTSAGGTNSLGTVFRLTTNGTLTTLVNFNGTNGATPTAELTAEVNGNLYGTTFAGGRSDLGIVFQLTTNGELTTLVTFNGTNGSRPSAGLMQGADRNLYGAAQRGGPGPSDAGNIFRVVMPSPSVFLNGKRSGTDLVLSWPTNASGFVLEWTPDLSFPIGWSSYTNSPASIGSEFVITNPASGDPQFYRLRKTDGANIN